MDCIDATLEPCWGIAAVTGDSVQHNPHKRVTGSSTTSSMQIIWTYESLHRCNFPLAGATCTFVSQIMVISYSLTATLILKSIGRSRRDVEHTDGYVKAKELTPMAPSWHAQWTESVIRVLDLRSIKVWLWNGCMHSYQWLVLFLFPGITPSVQMAIVKCPLDVVSPVVSETPLATLQLPRLIITIVLVLWYKVGPLNRAPSQ